MCIPLFPIIDRPDAHRAMQMRVVKYLNVDKCEPNIVADTSLSLLESTVFLGCLINDQKLETNNIYLRS